MYTVNIQYIEGKLTCTAIIQQTFSLQLQDQRQLVQIRGSKYLQSVKQTSLLQNSSHTYFTAHSKCFEWIVVGPRTQP